MSDVERVTHGRHCICSACGAEDWTNPNLAPCGMHGVGCPPVYAPLGAAGQQVRAAASTSPWLRALSMAVEAVRERDEARAEAERERERAERYLTGVVNLSAAVGKAERERDEARAEREKWRVYALRLMGIRDEYGEPAVLRAERDEAQAEAERLRAATAAAMLAEFHRVFAHPDDTPQSRRACRAMLHEEEHAELIEALGEHDVRHIAHELADVVYVAYGTAHAYGIDLDVALREVHRANMSKLGEDGRPIQRSDGKVVKGPSYRPPDMTNAVLNDLPAGNRVGPASKPSGGGNGESLAPDAPGGQSYDAGYHDGWKAERAEWLAEIPEGHYLSPRAAVAAAVEARTREIAEWVRLGGHGVTADAIESRFLSGGDDA